MFADDAETPGGQVKYAGFQPNPVVQFCRALVGELVAIQADAVPADCVRAGSWGSISHKGRSQDSGNCSHLAV